MDLIRVVMKDDRSFAQADYLVCGTGMIDRIGGIKWHLLIDTGTPDCSISNGKSAQSTTAQMVYCGMELYLAFFGAYTASVGS